MRSEVIGTGSAIVKIGRADILRQRIDQRVVAGITVDHIVARAAVDNIVIVAAMYHIVAGTAVDDVIAVITLYGVIAAVAPDDIVAAYLRAGQVDNVVSVDGNNVFDTVERQVRAG